MSEVRYSLLVDTDNVNIINVDKPTELSNQIGLCTLKIGTDMGVCSDVTTIAHIDSEKDLLSIRSYKEYAEYIKRLREKMGL